MSILEPIYLLPHPHQHCSFQEWLLKPGSRLLQGQRVGPELAGGVGVGVGSSPSPTLPASGPRLTPCSGSLGTTLNLAPGSSNNGHYINDT